MTELALNAERIHAAVDWPATLESLGIPGDALAFKNGRRSKNGPCLICGGIDRWFFDNKTGRGDYFCNQCGPGDGFTLLMGTFGWSFKEARRRVIETAGLISESPDSRPPAAIPRQPPVRPEAPTLADWSDKAEAIWRKTTSLRGSLGEEYLRNRGCALPPRDSHLRFLPAIEGHPPSLCAAITDISTAKPISLHFTRLAADGLAKAGTHRDRHLLEGHRKAGGCIRLWPDEAVTTGLACAEGIETSLAAAHAYQPIWATIDAGNMGSFPLMAGIETFVVFADNDAAGLKGATAAAKRWKDAGRNVRFFVPPAQGDDVNDLVAHSGQGGQSIRS